MRVVAFTTTTTDSPYIDYINIMVESFLLYNTSIKMVVFVLDGNLDKLKSLNFNNVEFIDFSKCKTFEYIKYVNIRDCSSTFSFGSDKLLNILAGPECLDYMYSHYDYDVLYRTDTDVLYTGKLVFENFYKSNKAFGGCKEYMWRVWTKETFGYTVPIHDDILNVGMSMYRKSLQVSDMFDRMKSLFSDWDYKFNTYEQDVINYVYQGSKYDLNRDGFYLGVNPSVIYSADLVQCRAFHFVSKDLKPFSLNITSLYEWTLPIYKKYDRFLELCSIDARLNYEYKESFLEKCFMRVAFYSSCTGDKKYIDMGIVTISSYLSTNTLEVDWIILCEDEEEISNVSYRLSQIETDRVHFRYELLPKDDVGLDYSKYNSFGWTSERGAEIFTRRIKFVDVIKDEYDILCCVDLDIIFVGDIQPYILQVYESESCALLGQHEPFMVEYNLKAHCGMENVEIPFEVDKYINFGFAVMNPKLVRNDNWEHFLEISKDKEYLFNTQEQAYFCASIPSANKITYNDLQLLIYPRLSFRQYRVRGRYKVIHFSPTTFITQKVELHGKLECGDEFVRKNAISIICFDVYYATMKNIKHLLTDEFISILDHNKYVLDKIKKFDMVNYLKLKLNMGI